MSLLLAAVVGIPVAWHVAVVAGVYRDAGRTGMGRQKWATITFTVPVIGFFVYLLERSERNADEDDPYAGGGYNFHESARSGDDGERQP
jgi:hypothetical protein